MTDLTQLQPDPIRTAGQPLQKASHVLIMLHGRGGDANDMLALASHLIVPQFALLAPQAPNHSWYPKSFLAPLVQNDPWLSSSLAMLTDIIMSLEKQGFSKTDMYWLGFSQGACLALDYVARNATRYGGVIAFTGGLIGDKIYAENYTGSLEETPIFIGTSNPDFHVPVDRVEATATTLRRMGAIVNLKIYENIGHTIVEDEIDLANSFIFKE